jgi:hypothetical protein
MATISRRLILALVFSAASVRFGAAQVVVDVAPAGVSMAVPAVIGAAGAPSQPMVLPSLDFARNLAFQMKGIAPEPGVRISQALPAQLRGALQAQVNAGIPQNEAVATQNILVQALSDPQVRAAIQEHLRQTAAPENPALGREAAEKLAGLAAAAQSQESRAALDRYAGELKNALAASIAGDDREFAHLFDGLARTDRGPVTSIMGDEPDYSRLSAGKIRKPLAKSDGNVSRSSTPQALSLLAAVRADDQRDQNAFTRLVGLYIAGAALMLTGILSTGLGTAAAMALSMIGGYAAGVGLVALAVKADARRTGRTLEQGPLEAFFTKMAIYVTPIAGTMALGLFIGGLPAALAIGLTAAAGLGAARLLAALTERRGGELTGGFGALLFSGALSGSLLGLHYVTPLLARLLH